MGAVVCRTPQGLSRLGSRNCRYSLETGLLSGLVYEAVAFGGVWGLGLWAQLNPRRKSVLPGSAAPTG